MKLWVLVLLAISQNNPTDIPGQIRIEFQSLQECEQSLQSMTYSLKFDSFKIVGHCERK